MPKTGKRRVEDYESDGGLISDEEGPKSKRSKKSNNSSSAVPGAALSKFWSLSTGRQPRRVEISEFKNAKLINIREFYVKDEQYLPGKKGISLTVEQYIEFVKAIPEINADLEQLGIKFEEEEDPDNDEVKEDLKPQKQKVRVVKEKSNIEETSDEDEG